MPQPQAMATPLIRPLTPRWHCQLCIRSRTSPLSRPLSTTTPARAIGPESPKYIDIPEPPQQQAPERRRVKGILPVPRDVLKHRLPSTSTSTSTTQSTSRRRRRPTLEASIALSTKSPTHAPTTPLTPRLEWRNRMATRRKQNLQEAITELRSRREAEASALQAQRATRAAEKEASQRAALTRDDERYTSPSIVAANATPMTAPYLPDPNREARLARKRANVAIRAAEKAEDRGRALRELYFRARSFVTNEEQLRVAIDEAFGTPEAPRTWGGGFRGESVWFEGEPLTPYEMAGKAAAAPGGYGSGQGAGKARDREDANTRVTERRMKRVVEELTGGKMVS